MRADQAAMAALSPPLAIRYAMPPGPGPAPALALGAGPPDTGARLPAAKYSYALDQASGMAPAWWNWMPGSMGPMSPDGWWPPRPPNRSAHQLPMLCRTAPPYPSRTWAAPDWP